MSGKIAYTPAEFAQCFGREKTWTYRLRAQGKIKVIEDFGKLMIPASELDRIRNSGRYRIKEPGGDLQQEHSITENPHPAGSAQWSAWLQKRKAVSTKRKTSAGRSRSFKGLGKRS